MSEETTLAEIADRLRPIFEKYEVDRAIVFGSFARGDVTRRSDLDLIVVQQTDERFLARYEGIFVEICRAIPTWGVDLLIYTPEELEQVADRPFIKKALQEGKSIYERTQESLSG